MTVASGPDAGGGALPSAGLPHDLHECEFADTIDGDIEIQLAFGRLHCGDVDVEVADRIGLERLLAGSSPSTSTG
jgi:hypothetical protein